MIRYFLALVLIFHSVKSFGRKRCESHRDCHFFSDCLPDPDEPTLKTCQHKDLSGLEQYYCKENGLCMFDYQCGRNELFEPGICRKNLCKCNTFDEGFAVSLCQTGVMCENDLDCGLIGEGDCVQGIIFYRERIFKGR